MNDRGFIGFLLVGTALLIGIVTFVEITGRRFRKRLEERRANKSRTDDIRGPK